MIFNCHLCFSVGAEIFKCSVLSYLGKSYRQLVRHRNRQRHKLGSFVTSVTEHQSLISRARIHSVALALLCLKGLVNSKSDVGRLLVDSALYRAGLKVKAYFLISISDILYGSADDSLNVYFCRGGDLTHYVYTVGGTKCLTRHAGHGVIC